MPSPAFCLPVWLGLLILLCLPQGLVAAVRLPVDVPLWPLTPYAQYWIDPSGQAGFPDALEAPFQAIANPNFGNRWGALWLRLAIDNQGPAVERILRVCPAMLEQVDLWQSGMAGISRQAGGLVTPQSLRAVPGRCSLFPLRLPGGVSEWYLRLASPSKLRPDLMLGEVAALSREARVADIRSALMFGSLLMTATMSLFYTLKMREWTWICFALGIFSYVVEQASYEGFAAEWLWPEHAAWSLTVFPMTMALTQSLMAVFLLAFIPRNGLHRAWGLLWGLPAANAMGLGVVFLVDYRYGLPLLEVAALISLLALPIFSLAAWRAGFRPARYAFASFGLVYAATLSRLATLYGWWPKLYFADLWLMPLSGIAASALLMLAVIVKRADINQMKNAI